LKGFPLAISLLGECNDENEAIEFVSLRASLKFVFVNLGALLADASQVENKADEDGDGNDVDNDDADARDDDAEPVDKGDENGAGGTEGIDGKFGKDCPKAGVCGDCSAEEMTVLYFGGDFSISWAVGVPIICIIIFSNSLLFLAGKSGSRVIISAKIHPVAHISTDFE